MLIQAEGAQAAEQHVIAQHGARQRANGCGVEQITGQRGKAEFVARAMSFEQAEGGEHCQPEIVVAFVGEMALFGQQAQAFETVVAAVNIPLLAAARRRKYQITFFDDEQEKQAIN